MFYHTLQLSDSYLSIPDKPHSEPESLSFFTEVFHSLAILNKNVMKKD